MDPQRADPFDDVLATEDELSPPDQNEQDTTPVRARQDPAEQLGAWAGENPGLAGVGLLLGGAALHSFLSTGSGSTRTTKVSAEDDPDEVLAEALASLNMEPNHADDLAEEIVGRLPDDMDNLETFNELQKRMRAEGFESKRIGECWGRIKENRDDE